MTGDDRFQLLVGSYLDGQLTADETSELIARLRGDRAAISEFADVAYADVLMEQFFHRADIDAAADSLLAYLQTPNRAVRLQPTAPTNRLGSLADAQPRDAEQRSRNLIPLRWLAAASILLAFAALLISHNWRAHLLADAKVNPNSERLAAISSVATDRGAVVATVEQAKQVDAIASQFPTAGTQLLSGESVDINSGLLQVHVLAGADLIIKGPARLDFISPLRAVLRRGTVTARVADTAHGFRIDTPNANVIDLGTEFGISASEGGDTNVVVFAGEVEMHVAAAELDNQAAAGAASDSLDRHLLRTGDGLRIGSGGGVSRLVAINSAEYPTSMSASETPAHKQPLVSAVSDNLREGATSKCYRIVPHGLTEDAPAYVDRTHQWNGVDRSGLPEFLRDADYIMPFNDDKLADRLEVTIALAAPARLYVFVDDRVAAPAWVKQRFVNTGRKIGLDEGNYPNVEKSIGVGSGVSIDNTFSIWAMDVKHVDTVTLGSLETSEERSSMYGIAAVPLDQFDPH